MYVSSIFLDRFGRKANVRLANLVDGLNVISGPPASGKTTLVDFLRAMWNGFDTRLREQYLPAESRGFGGVISIQTSHGRQTISRYDDGGPEGRLTVEREDGAVIGRRDLHDLIGDVSATLLERAFLVDFQRRPRLADMFAAVNGRGHRFGPRASTTAAFQTVDTVLAEKRAQLAQLGPETVEIQYEQQPVAPSVPDRSRDLAGQLAALDAQLTRWKHTLREVVARKQRAAERSDRRQLGAAATAASNAAPRRRLLALETKIQELQQSLNQVKTDRDCVCQTLRTTLGDTLQLMCEEVYQICNDLNHWQSHHQHRKAIAEREQLTRCERELRLAIQSLTERRQAVVQRLVATNPAVCRHPDHGPHCQCASHPLATTEIEVVCSTQTDVDRLTREAELRRELLREISQLEEEWRRLHEPSDPTDLVRSASQYLRRLSSEEWLQIEVTSPPDVWITGAHGKRFRYDDLDYGTRDQVYLAFCLAIVATCDRDDVRMPLVLNAPFAHYPAKHVSGALQLLREVGRDRQVLCLTRHEHVVGLARMMNVPVHTISSNVESGIVRPREAFELSELHPLSLPSPYYSPMGTSPHVRTDQWDAEEFPGELTDRTRFPTSKVKPIVNVEPAVRRPLPVVPRAVPIEVVQPTIVEPPAPEPPAPGQIVAEYYLFETDPIERAPSIDETNAHRLRTIGIARVGDLLRAAATQCAADLQAWGTTREMVQSWQSQARLMCHVRRLRPYDARILVACGIADPVQLTEMNSAALRARVKEFAVSAKGQAILSSGTESELSRVLEWVQTARDGRPRNGSRPEDTSGEERIRSTKLAKRRNRTRSDSGQESNRPDRSGTRERRFVDKVADRDSERHAQQGLRFRLRRSDSLVDAPSIGPGMAKRMEKLGVIYVNDLLNGDADTIASRLQMSRVTAAVVRQWQQQAALVCRVPRLSGKDSRILVSVGVTTAEQLAATDATDLWQRVQAFCNTLEGKRSLRNGTEPDAAEVASWIQGGAMPER